MRGLFESDAIENTPEIPKCYHPAEKVQKVTAIRNVCSRLQWNFMLDSPPRHRDRINLQQPGVYSWAQ